MARARKCSLAAAFAVCLVALELRFGLTKGVRAWHPAATAVGSRQDPSALSGSLPPAMLEQSRKAHVIHAPPPRASAPPLPFHVPFSLPPIASISTPPLVLWPPPPPPAAVPSTRSAGDSCAWMQSTYSVVVGASWGSLSKSMQSEWTRLGCDAQIRSGGPLGAKGSLPELFRDAHSFLADYRTQHMAALSGRDASRRLRRNTTASDHVVIAVCVCTTSRGFHPSRLEQLSLFRLALPSLMRSLNAEVRASGAHLPFELWIYVAYDAGDTFYDRPEQEAEIRRWLEQRLVGPLKESGIMTQHVLLRFPNAMRKPGPVFNFMTAAAAQDGADYIYRINDDTEFVGPWVMQAVRTLRGYSPSNVGVVGPICHEGNTAILTHDFVHRTHLDIFEFYYPPILSDWWMDDWITHVYAPSRFTKGPFLVRHHVSMHGTRYSVDYQHEKQLQREVDDGRTRVAQWLRSSSGGR